MSTLKIHLRSGSNLRTAGALHRELTRALHVEDVDAATVALTGLLVEAHLTYAAIDILIDQARAHHDSRYLGPLIYADTLREGQYALRLYYKKYHPVSAAEREILLGLLLDNWKETLTELEECGRLLHGAAPSTPVT